MSLKADPDDQNTTKMKEKFYENNLTNKNRRQNLKLVPFQNDKRFNRFNIRKQSSKVLDRNQILHESEVRYLPRMVSSSLSVN